MTYTPKERQTLNDWLSLRGMPSATHDAMMALLESANSEFVTSLRAQYARYNSKLTSKQWSALHARLDASGNGNADNAVRTASEIAARNNVVKAISNTQRNGIVRPAVTKAPLWKTYRAEKGIDSRALYSTAALKDAATYCGIDIQDVLAQHNSTLRKQGKSAFKKVGKSSDDSTTVPPTHFDERKVREIAKQEASKLITPKVTTTVVYETQQGEQGEPVENAHPEFATLLRLLSIRDQKGFSFGVMLVGPAATGKTHACEAAAKVLKISFFCQSTALEGFDLLGVVYANGEYITTPFVDAFTNGGVFLCDEGDAWEPAALLALNSALANGWTTLPTGDVVKRHKDFICIMATNTYGQGADAEYSARNKLDGSTLSRFPYKVDWQPVADTEKAIVENFTQDDQKAKDWVSELQIARDVLTDAGLPRLADLRGMLAGAGAIVQGGFTPDEMRDLTYLAGLDADQRSAITAKVKLTLARSNRTQS